MNGEEDKPPPVSPQREANVAYANSLMETEIAQRNARKDSQEGTARWIVASTVVLVTLLIGLANDEGVFRSSAHVVGRVALVVTVVLGGLAVFCAIGCLWPRQYDRLGATGLVKFNRTEFLDKPEHEVMGQVVATRVGIARKMDELHEAKAKWLKWSFRFLLAAFVGLIVQGAVLAIDPPTTSSAPSSNVKGGLKAAQPEQSAASATTRQGARDNDSHQNRPVRPRGPARDGARHSVRPPTDRAGRTASAVHPCRHRAKTHAATATVETSVRAPTDGS